MNGHTNNVNIDGNNKVFFFLNYEELYCVVKSGPAQNLPLSPFSARAPFAGEGRVLAHWTTG